MNSSDKNLLIDYKLELPESGDYIVLNGSPKRLLPKHLRDSIFIESKRMKMNRTVNKQGIDLKAAQTAIRSVRLKVEDIAYKIQQPITVFLTCGTLLGWYRENSIIPHTSDLDFAVKEEDLSNRSEEFIQHVESSFEMRDRIGFMNSSLEFRLTMPNVEFDLFIHYHDLNDPQKRDYVPGFDFNNNQTVFWHSPHVKELCAGVLLQSLVYVPCNVEELLVAYYGNEWTIDCETRKCNYRKDIITQRGQKYTKEQMKEVIKLPSRKST
ncbi:hypothetical protein M3Y97_00298300 [Aphelenchoides bicaudatus]|nr:hypothetical protein M3Y97_00298300 [Aphelenchoides bicaudatus]